MLLCLCKVIVTFSLGLISLFELDFPSYCLLLGVIIIVISFILPNITRKIGHRKDGMLPVLANEGLRGLCSGLVLGLDAALELAAHRRYIQRIA